MVAAEPPEETEGSQRWRALFAVEAVNPLRPRPTISTGFCWDMRTRRTKEESCCE